jgi:hypothetical protein
MKKVFDVVCRPINFCHAILSAHFFFSWCYIYIYLFLKDCNTHFFLFYQKKIQSSELLCVVGYLFLFTLSVFLCILLQTGIFGYLNYLVKRDRRFIADILINGLHRLEYRGYDSSGVAFDGDIIEPNNSDKRACIVVRQKGKVEELEHALAGK